MNSLQIENVANSEIRNGYGDGQGGRMHEHTGTTENVVGLLDTAEDVEVQSQKLSSGLPMQNLRRVVSVPYMVPDHVVNDHASLASEVLPFAPDGRVCIQYALTDTAPRFESIVDSSALADVKEMMEKVDGPEPGIGHRFEHNGCPKCPVVSPSSEVRPQSVFQTTTSISDSCTQSDSKQERILALEKELQELKEKRTHGSPIPEPSTSTIIPTVPLAMPNLNIAQNAENVDVDTVDAHPTQSTAVPNMKDVLKDLDGAKDKLKPVPFTRYSDGTPFRRRRSGGSTSSRFSGNMDHGTMITEALRKKFAGINGDQSPQRVSECQGDNEWNSSFDGTPTDKPWEEGDGQKVLATRVSRRKSTSTPRRMQGNGEE